MLSDRTEDSYRSMLDALIEHQPDDPHFGDPLAWPSEWDDDVVALGSAMSRQESWCDTYEPSDDDQAAYLDQLEREAFERRYCRRVEF